jgi:N-acetylglucosaminyldiphosphoundecaprenol N-acetyl-beta-D-mannosaminyltransferase
MKEITFMNCPMHPVSMTETVDAIKAKIGQGQFVQHVVVNVAKLVNVQSNKTLFDSVASSDIINIDGQGVVLGAKAMGHDIPERVAGIDLFYELLAMSEQQQYPIFLLGAEQIVLDKTINEINRLYPNLDIAGSQHGYFDDETQVVKKVKQSGAKLLFVAMSSPKKENFINKWREQLGVNFVMGVGGTFDVVAGKVKRAPVWMQKSGLEWLYRIIQEPRRMFMRYLVTNSKFLLLLIKEKMKANRVKRNASREI